MVKIAIITYSLYGHIDKLAKAIQEGIESAGGKADIYRVAETLSDEILEKMHAPPKDESIPIITKDILLQYDAYLFGVPTRYGNCSAQWSAFWDRTGGLWVQGSLSGKAAGFFVCTAGYGGGQESTVKACLNYLAHHGILYIPMGYKDSFAELANLNEVHGGSPWGAGTLAGADGSRTPSELELRVAHTQGKNFYGTVNKIFPEKLPESKNETQKDPVTQNCNNNVKQESTNGATSNEKEKKSNLCCIIV